MSDREKLAELLAYAEDQYRGTVSTIDRMGAAFHLGAYAPGGRESKNVQVEPAPPNSVPRWLIDMVSNIKGQAAAANPLPRVAYPPGMSYRIPPLEEQLSTTNFSWRK